MARQRPRQPLGREHRVGSLLARLGEHRLVVDLLDRVVAEIPAEEAHDQHHRDQDHEQRSDHVPGGRRFLAARHPAIVPARDPATSSARECAMRAVERRDPAGRAPPPSCGGDTWCPWSPSSCSAYGLHLAGLDLSVRIGSAHPVIATVVFVLAVLARVGSLVIMLWLCRPPGDHETALDVAGAGHRPVPRRLRACGGWSTTRCTPCSPPTSRSAASAGWTRGRSTCSGSVSTSSWRWSPGCCVSSSDFSLGADPYRPMLLLGAVLEGVWTFASALAVLAGLDRTGRMGDVARRLAGTRRWLVRLPGRAAGPPAAVRPDPAGGRGRAGRLADAQR